MPDAEQIPPDVEQVLVSCLSRFAGWRLSIGCPICRMLRRIQVSDVLTRVGTRATVSQVVARLRCRDCGCPPHWIELANHEHGTASGPVHEFVLLDKTERIKNALRPRER